MDSITADLSKLAISCSFDSYYIGEYDARKVIINVENGYINVADLCKNAGRNFKEWLNNEWAQRIIGALAESENMSADSLIDRPDNDIVYYGIYVHPKLFPFILSWIDPAFAIRTANCINFAVVHETLPIYEQITDFEEQIAHLRAIDATPSYMKH